jgi:hypothetical protein
MDNISIALWQIIDSHMLKRDMLSEHVIGVRVFDADGRDCVVLFSEEEVKDMIDNNPKDLHIEVHKRLNLGAVVVSRRQKKTTGVNE